MSKQSKPSKQKKNTPVVFYESEAQEFSGITRAPYEIGADYPYFKRSTLWKLASFFAYRVIMTPFAFLYAKCKFRLKITNRRAFRKIGREGYFVYGNHTLMAGDAFFPSLASFPRKTVVVVKSDNLAISATRPWIELCGALPIPTKPSGMRRFREAITLAAKRGYGIQIYPEAHIWPYYTGIRPFGSEAFRYPVKLSAPVFCTTVTYQKKKIGKAPRVTLYVDGPFYPDPTRTQREQADALCQTVYSTMCLRAQSSTYDAIRYLPSEKKVSSAQASPKESIPCDASADQQL